MKIRLNDAVKATWRSMGREGGLEAAWAWFDSLRIRMSREPWTLQPIQKADPAHSLDDLILCRCMLLRADPAFTPKEPNKAVECPNCREVIVWRSQATPQWSVVAGLHEI